MFADMAEACLPKKEKVLLHIPSHFYLHYLLILSGIGFYVLYDLNKNSSKLIQGNYKRSDKMASKYSSSD